VLSVADDGKGFVAEGRRSPTVGHYGLTGMRERAALIQGKIDIASEPGKGTTVKLKVSAPVDRDRTNVPEEAGMANSEESKEQL
jgi:two-component system sensor histidine kinase UhpB